MAIFSLKDLFLYLICKKNLIVNYKPEHHLALLLYLLTHMLITNIYFIFLLYFESWNILCTMKNFHFVKHYLLHKQNLYNKLHISVVFLITSLQCLKKVVKLFPSANNKRLEQ